MPQARQEGNRREPLTESERLAKLRKVENEPAVNPDYGGITPADMARRLLKPRRPMRPQKGQETRS